MTRIPDSVIEAIKDRTDIVALVGEQVRLTRSGREYRGLCPFHNEKTPSFYVVPEKGIFYCFGCGKGGDAAKFLMESERLSWPEAIRNLAKRLDIEVPEGDDGTTPEEERERQSLYELYDRLSKTFAWFLVKNAAGESARSLLAARGISEATREAFRLGFAPASRDWLLDFLSGKGYSRDFLARSGLFSANHPDFPLFAGRLIFPIMDQKGRCISFGGRIMEGEGPKYLNGPDTPIFHKQENLFALDRAREAIKKANLAIVCEGYMDAISLHEAGLCHAVAPLGTAFTERQARTLRRLCDAVVFAFDADTAGQNATARALPVAARAGLECRVVNLPGGKDPSEILEKEGAESLHKIADLIKSGGDFLIRRARSQFDTTTMEGKAKAVESIQAYALALDSEVKRDAFLELASGQLRIDRRAMESDILRSGRGQARTADEAPRDRGGAYFDRKRSRELVFLLAVAVHGETFARVRTAVGPEDLEDPRAKDLYFALEEAFRSDSLDLPSIVARMGNEDMKKAVMEAAATGEFDEQFDRLIDDGIAHSRRRALERRRDELLVRMEGDGNLQELLVEKMHLDAELAKLKDVRDERP
jgi:DNA primase